MSLNIYSVFIFVDLTYLSHFTVILGNFARRNIAFYTLSFSSSPLKISYDLTFFHVLAFLFLSEVTASSNLVASLF